MKVNIFYCNSWSYRPKASRAGDEIIAVYSDADIVGVPGGSGVFEIVVDGKIIFSKEKEGRFPINGELIKRIKEMEL